MDRGLLCPMHLLTIIDFFHFTRQRASKYQQQCNSLFLLEFLLVSHVPQLLYVRDRTIVQPRADAPPTQRLLLKRMKIRVLHNITPLLMPEVSGMEWTSSLRAPDSFGLSSAQKSYCMLFRAQTLRRHDRAPAYLF